MAQFCFIGGFSFVQQAEDTEALTEFQFRSQFTDGFLSADDFFLSLEMFPQPVGEAVFPGLCAGTVDVLEKGMRTENIQIIDGWGLCMLRRHRKKTYRNPERRVPAR